MDAELVQTEAAPEGAASAFGARMPLAARFVEILADTGVSHGLIGPREVPRLWDRHVLNCAVIQDAFPPSAEIVDVGSGAGLPGLALAIARPDLQMHLVEPMLRRTTWLETTVGELGLGNVEVHRGRAEELAGDLAAPWVTARAVARLDKLARWCVPLLTPGGTLVAMKGRSAAVELEEDRPALRRLGLATAEVTEHGGAILAEPVLTVDLTFESAPERGRSGSKRSGTRRSGSRRSGGERSGRERSGSAPSGAAKQRGAGPRPPS